MKYIECNSNSELEAIKNQVRAEGNDNWLNVHQDGITGKHYILVPGEQNPDRFGKPTHEPSVIDTLRNPDPVSSLDVSKLSEEQIAALKEKLGIK